MTAEELINNNLLSNCVIDKDQQVVFLPIVQTAIKMARMDEKERAADLFCEQCNKDIAMCKISKKTDHSCRDNCPAYNEFCESLF